MIDGIWCDVKIPDSKKRVTQYIAKETNFAPTKKIFFSPGEEVEQRRNYQEGCCWESKAQGQNVGSTKLWTIQEAGLPQQVAKFKVRENPFSFFGRIFLRFLTDHKQQLLEKNDLQ